MGAVANTVSGTLTPTAMWGVVGDAMPIVLPLVLFGFGFLLVRRIIKGSTSGKAKI